MNVITIEKNIPIPPCSRSIGPKYIFLNDMEIGDSFVVNGNTPDITAKQMRTYIYGKNASQPTTKYRVRTLEGRHHNPIAIRVWRVA